MKKLCVGCKTELKTLVDVMSFGSQSYCDNDKCMRFGLVTLMVINIEDEQMKESD